MPPDPDDCDAHHIVPKKEGRLWAKVNADAAREILLACSIDIDSAANGVYLPGKPNAAGCRGAYHKKVHTNNYYKSVHARLSGANDSDGCSGVHRELINIRHDLMIGGL